MTNEATLTSEQKRAVDRMALRDAVPMFVPALPFGFIVGVAMTQSAMPTWVAWLTSPLIFAGASQLGVITLAGHATLWGVIVAGLVINLRHVMYAAALAQPMQRQPRWFRWFAPFLLIDQVFALVTLRLTESPDTSPVAGSPAALRRYYLVVGGFFFSSWLVVSTLGMVIGPVIPDSWQLEFAIPVLFVGMVLIAVDKLPQAVAAVVGAAVGLATAGLQDRLGILVGAAAGIAAGSAAEAAWGERQLRAPLEGGH
ncbi:MAG TPA: AzlC family ABC transporter permease [Ilumatobacter sp.]|nr:AzlC family ABC transporter permease [Ilumatobacter sp.]